eukprot:TRINITY_DN9455_c0_g1_i1.p1 TRINITY_DN9455_c0_g1~~TRINITY_DN9455_c0_g1_i1.p1  ORF type:complete len:256 (-),score=0.84 TRINITY_DN9455_c0_g1_i1:39-806(-)
MEKADIVGNNMIETNGSCKDKCPYYNSYCLLKCNECEEFYCCARCHNEQIAKQSDLQFLQQHKTIGKCFGQTHDLQGNTTHILCRLCKKEQKICNTCKSCNVTFGSGHFCEKCLIIDCNVKERFHCDQCNRCVLGNPKDYVHCERCGFCVNSGNDHKCYSTPNCPICLNEFTESYEEIIRVSCGHIYHKQCVPKYFHSCYLCKKNIEKIVVDVSEDVEEPEACNIYSISSLETYVDTCCNRCLNWVAGKLNGYTY